MKIAIIGAGLGGLLVGANLVKEGYDVRIFERLSYPGGRFTNTERKGYLLSTGALHMIPHADKGALGKMLKELGADIEIVPSEPQGKFRIDGRDYLFKEFVNTFSLGDRAKLAAIFTRLTFGSGDMEPLNEWIMKRINNRLVLKTADSFCGWSLSISSKDISSKEFVAISKNISRLRGPGIPIGGCKSVTNALVELIEDKRISLKDRVKKIAVDDGRVKRVSTAREKYNCDAVISDAGPKATIKLCGEKNFPVDYVDSINSVKESCGIKISIACDKPMIGHSGILFTPQAERISGLNEVTNADPSLAPKGKHLMMSHQVWEAGRCVKEETEIGIKDLYKLFPDFKKYCKILAVQSYRKEWPVNRSISGEHIDPVSPVKGLYYVGDAIKPRGWMESDGVAAGVKLVLERIEKL